MIPFFTNKAEIFVIRFSKKIPLIIFPKELATPSIDFNKIFPANPSAITISYLCSRISLASIFPLKLAISSLSNLCASLYTLLPFDSSTPTLSNATEGVSIF